MGTLYSPIPLNDEAREWLATEGIAAPDSDGRCATPNELLVMLDSLEDNSVDYNISASNWQAQINDRHSPQTGPWTLLNVLNYKDNPDEQCHFYFAKGWPELIVRTVFRLSKSCGPYLVVPDIDCRPVVIQADSNVDELLATWEHLVGD